MAYNPSPGRRILLWRGVRIYIVARLIVSAFIGLQDAWLRTVELRATGGRSMSRLAFAPALACFFIALIGVLMLIDVRRRHETFLLANMGFNGVGIALCGMIPALAGELLLALLHR